LRSIPLLGLKPRSFLDHKIYDGASTDSGWFDDVTLDKVPDGFGKDSYTFDDVVDAYSKALKEENKDTITVSFP